MVHIHLSMSGCGMGSLETCTHIISRPKKFTHFFSLPKLIIIIIITFWPWKDILRGPEQLIHTKQPANPLTCWLFCNKWLTCVNEDNDEMKELLGITVFPLVAYDLFFPKYCDGIQIAQTHKTMFPLVSVQVWHREPGNMHP